MKTRPRGHFLTMLFLASFALKMMHMSDILCRFKFYFQRYILIEIIMIPLKRHCYCCCCCCQVASVVFDSVRPHRRQPTRLPRPWDSPGKNTGVGCHFLLQYMKVKSESEVSQSCLTLSDPTDCSTPGPSVLGIFQARVLEWGAIAFSCVNRMLKEK